MRDKTTELNLIQLKKAVRKAALPAEQQIAILKGFDVPFEVADDFDNWCRWALATTDVKLTDQQRQSLSTLDKILDEMSGEHNAELWTEDALRSRPEWEEVRRLARLILESFHCPIEDGGEETP